MSNSDEHGPLPPGWVTQISRSTGNRYWFNTKTGASMYTRPVPAPGPLTVPAGPPPLAPPLHDGGDAKRARLDGGDGGPPEMMSSRAPVLAQSHPAPGMLPLAAPARPLAGDAAAAMAVASAYDHLTDQGVAGRKQSSILHLKNFNNWVKALLIAGHAPQPGGPHRRPTGCERVLDLACGKLGDLAKWRLAGARTYCGVDISHTAVHDAASRFNDANARARGPAGQLVGKLARADLGVTDLTAVGVLAPDETFDAISIQFALHYLFQSEARALSFFRNVAGRLAPGGVFVGTIPDADYLVRRLRDELALRQQAHARELAAAAAAEMASDGGGAGGGCSSSAAAAAASTAATWIPPEGVSFGNAIYSVTFPATTIARQWAVGGNPYGLRYTFFLAESVEHVDEYLVPWPLLVRLAAAVGLVPAASGNFHDVFRECVASPAHRRTARAMRVFDVDGTLSPAEWEAAGVYRVFAFRRPAEGEPMPQVADDTPPLPPWSAVLPPAAAAAPPRPGPPLGYRAHLSPGDILDTIGGVA